MAEYGLRQPFCGFVYHLRSNPAESLWPKTSVSKDAVCFGFVSSDRAWAAAVLTLDAWPKAAHKWARLQGAGRAVRHLAPAPHQNRRPRRRDEDDDPRPSAHVVPSPGYLALRPRTHPAPRHLRNGASAAPNVEPSSLQPANLLHPTIRPQAGAAAARPQPSKIQGNRRNRQAMAPVRQSDAWLARIMRGGLADVA